MESIYIGSFEDLMLGHQRAEIICALTQRVVRTLLLEGPVVLFQTSDGTITVPLETCVHYIPVFLDRGDLSFNGNCKLCTEGDLIRYEDGTTVAIWPRTREGASESADGQAFAA